MARIVVGSFMVRFPLGGYLSWTLQWLAGFQRLGHDVYFFEKSAWENSCYDPLQNIMTDDCSYGTKVLDEFLTRFDLPGKWCYVDAEGRYHGLSEKRVQEVFETSDLIVDIGVHDDWFAEAPGKAIRVFVDGAPGHTQMAWVNSLEEGGADSHYDFYYSVGRNIGTDKSPVPTLGRQWRPVFYPVLPDLFPVHPAPADAPFTTIMSWENEPLEYQGVTYGQKAAEFPKFMSLPRRTTTPVEVAIGGEDVPEDELRAAGWRVADAGEVTMTFDSWRDYIRASRGEFSVCKNVYVATNSAWFSDRSACYLASGRPVVMQETGFSDHLPCGRGLFAVRTVEEAAAAIAEINGDYERHCKAARAIALEFLDTRKVLSKFLREVGIER
jgi:hypothetical protein